nr:MAG TPA: hypothetical protein [Caudoviricetes sp.]
MNTTNPVLENFYSLLKIPHGCFGRPCATALINAVAVKPLQV